MTELEDTLEPVEFYGLGVGGGFLFLVDREEGTIESLGDWKTSPLDILNFAMERYEGRIDFDREDEDNLKASANGFNDARTGRPFYPRAESDLFADAIATGLANAYFAGYVEALQTMMIPEPPKKKLIIEP